MMISKKFKFNHFLYILLIATLITSCNKAEYHCLCVESLCVHGNENKDSIMQCVFCNRDIEALKYMFICYENYEDWDMCSVFIADSTGHINYYSLDDDAFFEHNDTVEQFFLMKGFAMGAHHCYPAKDIFINMPDSLSELMRQAYLYHPTVHDISELAKDANNIDSLYRLVLMNSDIESYNKLRRLCERDTMFMASLETANRTHYPVACYDVYRYLIRNYRVSDETFQFAYKYLCMAADSMYYPAVLLKASLCLTGAYFPQDTILGKELLEQCQINTPIPFWQQYSKPPIYKHLLSRYTDNTRINVKQEP